MKWVVLLLLIVLMVLLFRGNPSSPAPAPSPPRTSATFAPTASGDSARFDDVFFIREPVDVSSMPWNGILNAGTPVRRVGQDGNKVTIETGNGRITVDAAKLTHDPKLGLQISDTLSRPASPGASTPAPTPSSGAPFVNPLVPPSSTGR